MTVIVTSILELEVQGYELDSFQHVNNAVYLNYLESARWKFLKDVGIVDYLLEQGIHPVVIETNIRYIRELKIFEHVKVESDWTIDGNYIVVAHRIYNEAGKKSATSVVKMLLVSRERLIYDIPDKLRDIVG